LKRYVLFFENYKESETIEQCDVMKKIMILGAGPFQLSAIKKAQKNGLSVIACSNNPSDPGMTIADISCPVSTLDKEQLLMVAKREAISGIMTVGSDISVPTVAFIAEHLRLQGTSQKIALTITDKGNFRTFLRDSGFPTPSFGVAETVDDALKIFTSFNRAAIMKPVLSSGSRGVFLIHSKKDLSEKFSQSIACSFGRKAVIIEEFIRGREVGGEALVFGGKIVFFHLTNKYINSWLVPTGHSMPSDLPVHIQIEVRTLIQRIVTALGIEASPINFDIMLTVKGPFILEMGCRLGGNCLPSLMTKSTGIDTIVNAIRVALGETPIIEPFNDPECYRVIILGSNNEGILQAITTELELFNMFPKNIISIQINCAIGDKIKKFDRGSNNLGYIFLKADTLNDLNKIADTIINEFKIITTE